MQSNRRAPSESKKSSSFKHVVNIVSVAATALAGRGLSSNVRPMSESHSNAAACRKMGAGMSMDLSRRPSSLCATWRSRLESSRMANVTPSWWGSLYKVIVLSGDGHSAPCKIAVSNRNP